MLIRGSLLFGAHLVAGIAFGALAVVAASRFNRRPIAAPDGNTPNPEPHGRHQPPQENA